MLREFHQARTLAHRGRDAHHALVRASHVAQPLAEDLRIRGLGLRVRRGLGLHEADLGIELAGPVVGDRVFLGVLVGLALVGDHVQELRSRQALHVGERVDQHVDVVAVDGTGVVEAEFLEHRRGRDHALGVLLDALGELLHLLGPIEHFGRLRVAA